MSAQLRELNDSFRRSFVGDRIAMTAGVAALSPRVVAEVIRRVKTFGDFEGDDDPYGEHDIGALEIEDTSIFWKIDYYDRALRFHSPDASNPAITQRVLTIMLASEY